MASSSRSVGALDFNQELTKREASFNRKIREYVCRFLRDVHVDFLIVMGSLFRIVNALTRLNEDCEEHKDIDKYLSYQNQICLFADQITTTQVLEGELNNLLICETEEEFKDKFIKVIRKLETNRGQKAIFVNSEKTTLEESAKNLGRGAVMQIDEMKRDVLYMYPNPNLDLYQASSSGDVKKVAKLLVDGVEVNSRVPETKNRTALHIALENGHKDVVLLLLAFGADVLIRDKDEQQPIDLAINSDKCDSVILRDIFKIDETMEPTGNTRLHMAVYNGEIVKAHMLVKLGANINAINKSRHTPLYLAVRNRDEVTAKLLVDLGADLNILCNSETVLDIADTHCSALFVNFLKGQGAKTGRQMRLAKSGI